MHNTWAEGLNPTYKPMNESQSRILITAVLSQGLTGAEENKELEAKVDAEFLIRILNSRIEGFKLPLVFNMGAKMACLALCTTPGDLVVLLIDCLNAFGPKVTGSDSTEPGQPRVITTDDLVQLYPMGFYDEETMRRYIDQYMKPRKVKWSEVYISR